MRAALLLAAAAAVMTLSTQAFAQSSPELAATLRSEDVAAVLRDAGFRAEMGPENESPRVHTGMGGYNVGVYLYNCDAERNCKNLQFSLGIRGMQNYPLANINKWNTEKRFARLAMDDRGSLWLRGDVYFYGGITRQMVNDTAQLFDSLVGDFRSGLRSWSARNEASTKSGSSASP